MTNERLTILRDLLIDLHQGARPEEVQERFNQHFTGVSAIEISLMEQELLASDAGITFEDIMALCNVHANLFKGHIQGVDEPDMAQEGHPVAVFKQENLALRAALLRIRRIFEQYDNPEHQAIQMELLKGLRHQLKLLAEFDKHYKRKEQVFFPIMERYGHDAPPKVMWGVDDQIRELFTVVQDLVEKLPQIPISEVKNAFEEFAAAFEEMIFKEEAILLMILLETFSQDDWLQVAEDSEIYGYAIIKPSQKWQPHRVNFDHDKPKDVTPVALTHKDTTEQIIDTPAGQLKISFTPKQDQPSDKLPFGKGYLTPEQANLILNHLPFELTFVNKDAIFQYYNDSVPEEEMIFKRNPSQIGRHVDLCHPPKVLEKVKAIFTQLQSGQRDQFDMWFKSKQTGQFVYVVYKAVKNQAGAFEGVLEYVQNIQPFFELDSDVKRDLD